MSDAIREPDEIRRDAARKLRTVQVSDHTPDGHLLERCDGEAPFKLFLGASKDIHGVVAVAELDGDEVGYLLGKVAEIKRQR